MRSLAKTRRKPATLAEVAAAAGVSQMTVSNVINAKPHAVTEDTRRKVEQAIRRLNYRPHAHARRLRLSASFSIGMMIVDEAPGFLADPFITALVAGLSNHLSEQGYSLTLQGVPPQRFETSTPFRSHELDGLCVLLSGPATQRRQSLDRLAALRQPMVVFQEQGCALPDLCVIRQDDHAGGVQVTEHLLATGASRFLLLVPALEWPAQVERERGVRTALARAGLEQALEVVACADESYDATQAALAAVLDRAAQRPDAIIGGNDQMAIAALQLLKQRGLRVPADIRVTGFNGFQFWRYSDPVLTTVSSPAYAMGERAGIELLHRLRDGSFRAPEIVLPVTFRPGPSSQAAPPLTPRRR